jgi:hypothetical protein
MAGANQFTVGTVPTLLVSAPVSSAVGPVGWFALANGTGATVYLSGGTAVTSSNGYPLGTSATTVAPSTLTGQLYAGDSLFGVVASGSSVVDVLQTGA